MNRAESSRYDAIVKLASGGMATVWVGTVRGALGFRQLVAIKKPHPHLLEDPSHRQELIAEARLASLIRHANVVDVRDVEIEGTAISLVMSYVEGASLAELVVAAEKRETCLPPRVAVRIALDALAGLHAAHELIDERGRPVSLVHRDVSPQNILVGVDGLARVTDFGVAKFTRKNNAGESSEGSLKGKLAYMAPEYLRGEVIDRRFDVFALGIVLWETLAGKRLFRGANEAETLRLVLEHPHEKLASVAPAAAALDDVLATALARSADERFQSAHAMAAALESSATAAGLCGTHGEVARALQDLAGTSIEERRALIRTKLAHEPSVASLMGHASPVTATARAPATAVPSTVPMTPRMENAPPLRTQLSPGGHAAAGPNGATVPMIAPAAIVVPVPIAASTLASAGPAQVAAPVAVAPLAVASTAVAPLAVASTAVLGVDEAPETPAARSRALPLVAGLVAALAGAVALALGLSAMQSRSSAAAAPSTTAATVAAPAPSSSAAPLPASPAVVASTSASAPSEAPGAPATTTSAIPSARRPAVTGPGPTAPLPTAKKPPPNPYR